MLSMGRGQGVVAAVVSAGVSPGAGSIELRGAPAAVGRPAAGLGVPTEAQKARLVREVERVYAGVRSGKRVAHATRDDMMRRTVRVYTDLHALGYVGLGLAGLRPHHVDGLLKLWRSGAKDVQGRWLRRPMARTSAANLWRVLRGWVPLIDKPGMVQAFDAVWPDAAVVDAEPGHRAVDAPGAAVTGGGASRQETVGPSSDSAPGRRGGRVDIVVAMNDAEYAAVLGVWAGDPTKRTHYWLVRAIRELGLTRREAFALDPYAASVRRPGILVLKAAKSRDGVRTVAVDTPAKEALVAALIAFVRDAGRARLVWPIARVATLAQADRKLASAVGYVLARVRAGQAGSVGSTAAVATEEVSL